MQNAKGLSTIMQANAQACHGVYEQGRQLNVSQDVLQRLQECERMCREIGESLNR